MGLEPINQRKLGHSTGRGDNDKQLHQEVKEMMTMLTQGLSGLQHTEKSGSSRRDEDDEDNGGARIITIAGSNTGATMRTDLTEITDPQLMAFGDPNALTTYANSNFQAINNSIMLGGSYTSNDPGVHMDISDYLEHHGQRLEEHGKKLKKIKKDKKQSESDQKSD